MDKMTASVATCQRGVLQLQCQYTHCPVTSLLYTFRQSCHVTGPHVSASFMLSSLVGQSGIHNCLTQPGYLYYAAIQRVTSPPPVLSFAGHAHMPKMTLTIPCRNLYELTSSQAPLQTRQQSSCTSP